MGESGSNSVLRRLALLCDRSLCPALLASLALAANPAVLHAAAPPPGPEAIARQVVAEALGIVPGGIVVVSSEARDFPDGSLGCPQPGMAYAQVITPGYQVIVEAAGRRFDVRVAGTGGRICYRRKAPREASASGPETSPATGDAARQDLARRLGLPAGDIAITGVRRLNPGDSLPGCGVVCAADAAGGDCGTSVRLRVADRDYEYVARRSGVEPCPDIASR